MDDSTAHLELIPATAINAFHFFLGVYLSVEGLGSRVDGSLSRVEGNNFFIFIFFRKMENKWKTNKKNLKNKWPVDISIQISSTCWVGRGETEHVT